MTNYEDTFDRDPEDIELKKIFGDRFIDETCEPKAVKKAEPVTFSKYEEDACDVSCEPAYHKPYFFGNLKAAARSALTFGGLNILIFYWERIGLMDESIAVPCMCACAALAGWGVGKNFAKK